MIMVRITWTILALLWMVAEIRLARHSRREEVEVLSVESRSQRRLWLALLVGLGVALFCKSRLWWPLPIPYFPRQALALALFVIGLALRYRAVVRLGSLFTTDVTIHRQHLLIEDGPYRKLRHPAYTGLLLALAAAGLAMGDGLAWLALVLPAFGAIKARIAVEEAMLHDTFGEDYQRYCATRWRLLPGLY